MPITITPRSGGDFDFYHGEAIPAADNEPETENENPGGDEEDDGVSESDTEYNDGIGGGLPAIDADAAVQTKNAKGKKR